MKFTLRNLNDWRDRQYRAPKGTLTFRLYIGGWLVRWTPHDGGETEKVEFCEDITACRFANERAAR